MSEAEAHTGRQRQREGSIALLGYSVETMEAAQRLGRNFVAVVPPGFGEALEADGVSVAEWDFELINEASDRLYHKLSEQGVDLAVPLFEETVEWAGALNARFYDDPKIFNRALLLRDKAMMKRRAQMSGIRVGVFEEVDGRDAVRRFFQRIQEALSIGDGEKAEPVHLKPTRAAGSVGHFMVRSMKDLEEIADDAFPCMVESHLQGQEFSCEVFVHRGKIRFLNINEYVHLGYSQLTPAGPELQGMRDQIERAVQKLIRAFDVQYGVLHPEYFLDPSGELNFGEVANRVPGGHIFELIQRAYDFDPFEALLLCADPKSSEEELDEFFSGIQPKGYAGNLMVYPRQRQIEQLAVPPELLDDDYFEKHNMFEPVTSKVAERAGFGNHYGTIFFFGSDARAMRGKLNHYEELDYYK